MIMAIATLDREKVTIPALIAAFDVIGKNIQTSGFGDPVKNYLRLCFNNFVFRKGVNEKGEGNRGLDMFDYLPYLDMTFSDFRERLETVPQKAFTQQGKVDMKMQEELGNFLDKTVSAAVFAAQNAMRSPVRSR